MRVVLVLAALVSLSAAASAKERLGTFTGSHVRQMGTAWQMGGTAERRLINFRLKGNRLYVWNQSSPDADPTSVPGWRQSFVVVSDQEKGGARVIQYVRPAEASRSAKYNLTQLARARSHEVSTHQVLDQLAGGGRVVVSHGHLRWDNYGTGWATGPVLGSEPVAWVEWFMGPRK